MTHGDRRGATIYLDRGCIFRRSFPTAWSSLHQLWVVHFLHHSYSSPALVALIHVSCLPILALLIYCRPTVMDKALCS